MTPNEGELRLAQAVRLAARHGGLSAQVTGKAKRWNLPPGAPPEIPCGIWCKGHPGGVCATFTGILDSTVARAIRLGLIEVTIRTPSGPLEVGPTPLGLRLAAEAYRVGGDDPIIRATRALRRG